MASFETLEKSAAAKTTWVFGAGASAPGPYRVPSQPDMLRAFFHKKFPGRGRRQSYIADLKEAIKADCQFILPGANPESETVSLEEVFSAYELMLSESRTAPKDREYAEEALGRMKEAIQLSTYALGRGDSKKWKPHGRGAVRSPYAELLEKLFPKDENERQTRNSFVTFNYDINLDRCLLNLRDTAGVDLDYGINLANHRTHRSPHFDNPNSGTTALLLRTHGALNWIRCDACQSIFTTLSKHADVSNTKKCWACGSKNLNTVLVHPSFIREYNDPIIRLIWGRCQEELVLSDRWVFVGYSLPTADVHFRELLRHCIRVRQAEGLPTDVCVIGRRQDGGDLLEPEAKRNYMSLFGQSVRFWESTADGFFDFPDYIV